MQPTGQNIPTELVQRFCVIQFPSSPTSLMSTAQKRVSVAGVIAWLPL